MPSEVHIIRLSEDMETELPITKQEWEECAAKLSNLQYSEEATFPCIQTFSKEFNDWVPVFWISEEGGSMRDTGFFKDEIFEKGIEIAQYLNAIIFGADGIVIYLAGHGVVFDPNEGDDFQLTLEDLRNYRPQYGNDFDAIIKASKKEQHQQAEQHYISIQAPTDATKPRKPWWKFW